MYNVYLYQYVVNNNNKSKINVDNIYNNVSLAITFN